MSIQLKINLPVSILILTLIFTLLVVLGANMHPLWGDEAETALFARNILKFGVPKGWDGVNLMGINEAVVLNKDLINHTSPWAQYYLTASSFLLLGESSFTARLPFILLSIPTIILIYLLAIKLTGDKVVAFFSSLILSLSVPYILFAYQARYFSVIALTSLLLTFSSLYIIEKKLWPKLLFLASLILFFYGNYEALLSFYLSLALTMMIYLFISNEPWERIKKFGFYFITLSLIAAVFTVPWYLIQQPSMGEFAVASPSFEAFFRVFTQNYQLLLYPFNQNNAFPQVVVLMIPIFLLLMLKQHQKLNPLVFILCIPLIFFLVKAVLPIVVKTDISILVVRYTMVVFPYFVIFIAIVAATLFRLNKLLGLVFLAVYLTTNLFTLDKPRSLLWEFANEVISPYQTPGKVVAEYLKQRANDGETVFVNLDRDHEPLIFHLGSKLKFVNRISYNNRRLFPDNRKVLPEYIFDFKGEPDWVILYSKRPWDGTFFTSDFRKLNPKINLEHDYRETVVPLFFSDLSRPELEYQTFSQIIPTYQDQVFIYQKIK